MGGERSVEGPRDAEGAFYIVLERAKFGADGNLFSAVRRGKGEFKGEGPP